MILALQYLQKRLADYKDKLGRPLSLPRQLVLQFDNATDQKNKELFAFCDLLCTNQMGHPAPFDIIYVNFLIPGHTHCSVDQKFSVIARKILDCNSILSPVALQNVIREAFSGSPHTVGDILFLDVILDWESYIAPFRNKAIHYYGVRYSWFFIFAVMCLHYLVLILVGTIPFLFPSAKRF